MKKIINCCFDFTRKIYDWTLHWAETKYSNYALFAIAFIESSFFPIPPDVLLIPLVVADPKSWWKKALICTFGSVGGAFLGYAIGYLFYETVGLAIINLYKIQSAMDVIAVKYSDNAFLTIFIGAFTPIPYKAMTIAAGIFKISIGTLFFASLIGRGGRFFAVAIAIRIFGVRIKSAIEKHFNTLSIFFAALLILGIAAFKLLLD
jgi:membrane protein YqaA with SNARE-associated domain